LRTKLFMIVNLKKESENIGNVWLQNELK